MPCDSSHLRATPLEEESIRVMELLREVNGEWFDHRRPHNQPYGDVPHLDQHTAQLCSWCRSHEKDLPRRSLELQLWWRDHQRADAEKEQANRKAKSQIEVRKRALSKLSVEEKESLGL